MMEEQRNAGFCDANEDDRRSFRRLEQSEKRTRIHSVSARLLQGLECAERIHTAERCEAFKKSDCFSTLDRLPVGVFKKPAPGVATPVV